MQEIKKFIKLIISDYRHFICLAITCIFILLAIFYFNNAWGRLLESFPDIATSGIYYISELFELELESEITVNNFTKLPFKMPWNLPNSWEEFKVLWDNYTNLLFSKENFRSYIYSLSDGLYYISKALVILMPFIMIFIILKSFNEVEINNDYNVDSKALTFFKTKIENSVYLKVKEWICSFISFLKENSFYLKIWLVIWCYSFNFITIIVEIIAYYLYFVASFDLVSIYIQVLKLLTDLSVMLDFIPGFLWLLILLSLMNYIRRNVGYKRLNHMEMMNRGFINERPVVFMACGTMGKKKTTLITDMALSQEIMFRDKAFEKILECDLKFPFFPWINLEITLKNAMEEHIIYNLATTKKFINHLKECFIVSKECPEYKKAIKKHLKKKYKIDYLNLLFDYDYERYGYTYDDKLKVVDIWDVIETYSQLYFIYIIQSSLMISNYSIRTDNILNDLGNFPLWNKDLFKKDSRLVQSYSRHSHIIDYDALRLGKTIIENNKKANSFEFGVVVLTEIGKERGNNLELLNVKKNDDTCNQKNDLFNSWLKMVRHSATVDNYPFVRVIVDEQRPESWGADARDLCEILYIDECSDFRLSMPLFALGDLICQWFLNKFSNSYYNYRFEHGNNTLLMYLYHGASGLLNKYHKGIYNTFGYYKMNLLVESGTQDGEKISKKYYLMSKKIYSKRFSTDCFSDYFNEKALKSQIGINDIEEFNTEKATFEEMALQNSYFFNDLIKLKEKGGKK